MNLYRRKNHVFGRIGDRYSSFIDPDHFMGRNAFEDSWIARPVTNIIKKDPSQFELEVGMPGYSKKDIKISVDGYVLRVVAEKKSSGKEQNTNYIQREIDTNRMEKTFYLSSLIDADKIVSHFENGLLHITLPFVSKSKSRAISIS
ncbi:MAG: Hsp20/alpha crystallin family protein [Ekhidna sp.]